MSTNFLQTNYSFILDNIFDCGEVSDIKPTLLGRNNNNPNNSNNRMPTFSPNTNVFNTYERIWCLNRENQHRCEPDNEYILVPKKDVSPSDILNYSNNLMYSNNILENITKNDENINVGKKFNSTGTNVNAENSYTSLDTSSNPYPFNTNFTPDNISLQKLNEINMEKVRACNNRSIENRFRPVYFHIPEQFLEICEPNPYKPRSMGSNINN